MTYEPIDSTQAQYFIPEIWAAEALEVLRSNIVTANLVRKDTDIAGGFTKGDILHIPYAGTFTAEAKVASTALEPQAPAGETEATVTLNKYYVVPMLIEDFVRACQNYDVRQEYIKSAMVALAEQLENDIISTMVTGFAANTVGSYGTDLTNATIMAARKKLTDNKAPTPERSMLIATKDTNAVLADTNLTNYFAYSNPGDLQNGQLNSKLLHSFTIYESQLVPAVAGTPISTKCLAWQKAAVVLAMRAFPPPDPDNASVKSTIVRDDLSGLVFEILQGYSMDHLGPTISVRVLYGVSVVDAARGVLVKT